MVVCYVEIHLWTVSMVVEDWVIVDQSHQRSLACPWEAGQCHAKGRTYIWNLTEPDYCQVAVIKEFPGHRLHANLSDPDAPQGQHQAEAIVSSETEEKIRIQIMGPISQWGRVMTATNIKDMFLFPITETNG